MILRYLISLFFFSRISFDWKEPKFLRCGDKRGNNEPEINNDVTTEEDKRGFLRTAD